MTSYTIGEGKDEWKLSCMEVCASGVTCSILRKRQPRRTRVCDIYCVQEETRRKL